MNLNNVYVYCNYWQKQKLDFTQAWLHSIVITGDVVTILVLFSSHVDTICFCKIAVVACSFQLMLRIEEILRDICDFMRQSDCTCHSDILSVLSHSTLYSVTESVTRVLEMDKATDWLSNLYKQNKVMYKSCYFVTVILFSTCYMCFICILPHGKEII